MQVLIQEVWRVAQDCISYKFPDDADAAGPHLNFSGKEARVQTIVFSFFWYFFSEATTKQSNIT